MDSLELIKTFHEVAARGSFSAAAKALGISKASVSKYVAELEARFDVRLLNRSTRAVTLTDAGAVLLERSKPVLELVALTTAELQEHASAPRGRLRVAAPPGLAHGALPRLFGEFMRYYPEVSISLQLGTRMVDLADEAVDVALRVGPIEDENIIMRRLLPMTQVVCAAPSYWQKHGKPTHPRDLSALHALTLSTLGPHPHWRFRENGRTLDVPVTSRMDTSEVAVLAQVAAQGVGVAYLPALPIQWLLDSGALEPVLGDFVRDDLWLCAAYLQRRHNSAALRAFVDFLESRVKGQPIDALRE